MTIEQLVKFGIVGLVIYGIVRWFMSADRTPDPWGTEIERAIEDLSTPELCHRCLTPQQGSGRFCAECGAAVGPYNNYMPFVRVFSEGEVLRAGISDHMRSSALIICGYVFLSFAVYAIFAPVYLYFFFRHLKGQVENSSAEETQV